LSSKTSVLIVDDEKFVRESLSEVLKAEGFSVHVADGARSALEKLGAARVDVVLTDLAMPRGNGLELLQEARARGFTIPIIVFSGVGTVASAIAAMKAGAHDFLQKPVDPDELVMCVRRAAEHRGLVAEVRSLRSRVSSLERGRELVGSSAAMQKLRASIARVAATDATVLVQGESGTGKSLVAEALHAASERREELLLRVDCASLGAARIERDLRAEALGGTLLLDEITALDDAAQQRLLPLLERQESPSAGPEPRVIALTREDLAVRVKKGAFRPELLYRLQVFPITTPPLRTRKEDLGELALHFLRAPLRAEEIEVLASYDWPGNVRELFNVFERARIVAGPEPIDAALLRSILESSSVTTPAAGPTNFVLRKNLDAAEKEILLRALTQTSWKKREACDLLGIDARNLGYYLRKHKIVDPRGGELAG
jgi:two-component system, NtrC family, response regulator AtoC